MEELSIILVNNNCSSAIIDNFRKHVTDGKLLSYCDNWFEIQDSLKLTPMNAKSLNEEYLSKWKKDGV
jgi:hypothetical protein